MDSIQPKFDEKIKTRVRNMISEGTEHIVNDYIIEDVVFVDSRYRAMSQTQILRVLSNRNPVF